MKPLRLLTVGLMLASAACSAVFSKRPPARVQPGGYPECGVATTTLAADVILAGLMGTLVVLSMASGDGDEPPTILGAAFGIGFGISAVHGFSIHAACRQARLDAGRGLDTRPMVVRPTTGAPAPVPVVPPPGAPLPGPLPPAAAQDGGAPDTRPSGG
jgi:hypothetical protein